MRVLDGGGLAGALGEVGALAAAGEPVTGSASDDPSGSVCTGSDEPLDGGVVAGGSSASATFAYANDAMSKGVAVAIARE